MVRYHRRSGFFAAREDFEPELERADFNHSPRIERGEEVGRALNGRQLIVTPTGCVLVSPESDYAGTDFTMTELG